MTTLHDIITRRTPPTPWQEGENIPWHEPAFSERMLFEHLNQDHDLASRRLAAVDAQIDWIHRVLLCERTVEVLDLACGPGLYLSRLGRLGHRGVGIDFSPASIAFARREAIAEDLPVQYLEGDIRETEFGDRYDLVMLLYGQLNVFRRSEASAILEKSYEAMVPGGILVAEPQIFGFVKETGCAGPSWSGHSSALFSDRPHLLLTESFWDEEARTAVQRFYVVDTASGEVTAHSMSTTAYSDAELVSLLSDAGFREVDILRSLTDDVASEELTVVVGRK